MRLAFGTGVKEAIDARRGVVALESTVIAHGLPRPKNLETARRYRDFAEATLRSLSSSAYLAAPGENGGFLLKHATGHRPAGKCARIGWSGCLSHFPFKISVNMCLL